MARKAGLSVKWLKDSTMAPTGLVVRCARVTVLKLILGYSRRFVSKYGIVICEKMITFAKFYSHDADIY